MTLFMPKCAGKNTCLYDYKVDFCPNLYRILDPVFEKKVIFFCNLLPRLRAKGPKTLPGGRRPI